MKKLLIKTLLFFGVLMLIGSCEKDSDTLIQPDPVTEVSDVYNQSAGVRSITVSPSSYDFPVVVVGESALTAITITNNDVFISETVSFEIEYGDPEFAIVYPTSPINIPLLSSVDLIIAFAPSSEGEFSGFLEIINGGIHGVVLEGTGVEVLPEPDPTIQDIIAFFDASVYEGTLYGVGQNDASRDAHVRVYRNILWRASDLFQEGDLEGGCNALHQADNRSDGENKPKDFVQGSALAELNDLVVEVIGLFGC